MYEYRNSGQTGVDVKARVLAFFSVLLVALGLYCLVVALHNFFTLGAGALVQLIFGASFISCGYMGIRASRTRSVLLAAQVSEAADKRSLHSSAVLVPSVAMRCLTYICRSMSRCLLLSLAYRFYSLVSVVQ